MLAPHLLGLGNEGRHVALGARVGYQRPYAPRSAFGGSEAQAMTQLLAEYLPLVVFIGVALAIGLALLVAPFLVAIQNPDSEKVSAYECGFNAFDDARMKFDVRFYLVAILFIMIEKARPATPVNRWLQWNSGR